jgi:hypothetical protein
MKIQKTAAMNVILGAYDRATAHLFDVAFVESLAAADAATKERLLRERVDAVISQFQREVMTVVANPGALSADH